MDKIRIWRVWSRHFDINSCSIREGRFTYFWSFEDAKRVYDLTKKSAIDAALEEVLLDRSSIGVVDCEDTDCNEIHLQFNDAAVVDSKVLEGWDRPSIDLEAFRLKCGV